MKLITVISKKIVQGATAVSANFRTPTAAAVRLQPVLTLRAQARPAVSLRTVLSLAQSVKPGVSVATRIVGGTFRARVQPAVALRSVLTVRAAQAPAANLVQVRYDLTRTPTSTVAQTGSGWTNPANAAGKHDGTLATLSASATAAVSGTLDFTYPPSSSKTTLSIVSVVLRVWWKQAGTLAAVPNGTLALSWSKGGAQIALATKAADFDATATPETYVLTPQIASWADIDAIKTRVTASYPAVTAVGVVDSVDAVELVVTATATDLL